MNKTIEKKALKLAGIQKGNVIYSDCEDDFLLVPSDENDTRIWSFNIAGNKIIDFDLCIE